MIVKFSIVIPIYNEEKNIPELCRRLTNVFDTLCNAEKLDVDSYEIIMVDDGSTDNSWSDIKAAHERDRRFKGISFSRNFGHHIAITAGLDYAKGDAVILMDGDLQDPPEEIPKLYEEFKKGYDLVYGIRQHRNDPVFKRITSFLFWWILRRFSGVDIPQGQTMMRLMSRRLVDALNEMREHARFIHGMMAWAGFNVTSVEVEHHARIRGKSKYNIAKMFRLAFNAVTSFSTVPLRLATYIGFISSFISLIVGLFFVYQKIIHGIPVPGYASIIVSIFFVGGVQLLVFGIFGEYLGRTYQEIQRRPLYILKEHIF
ncbi:MAG: glycosyltransferase family 2 protein [Nitrospirota bacterium]